MKKRLIAMSAAFCIFASGVGALSVSAINANTLFSDDFSSAELDRSWKKTGGTSIKDSQYSHGNVLSYASTETATSWNRVGHDITPVSDGTVNISFDMNVKSFDSSVSQLNSLELHLYNNNIASTDSWRPDGAGKNTVLRLSSISNTAYISPTKVSTDAWVDNAANYSYEVTTGEWVNVNIAVDLSNNNIEYYFNNKLYYTNTDCATVRQYLCKIGAVVIEGVPLAKNEEVWFDNFKVTKTAADGSQESAVITEDFSSQTLTSPLFSRNESVATYVDVTYPETSTGDYALKLARISGTDQSSNNSKKANLNFDINASGYQGHTKTTGKTVMEFDYLSNNKDNVNIKFCNPDNSNNYSNLIILYTTTAYAAPNTFIKENVENTLHHAKIVVDYDLKKFILTFDGTSQEVTFATLGYSGNTAVNKFKFASWAPDTMWYQLDNIKIYHLESAALSGISVDATESGYTVSANASAADSNLSNMCLIASFYNGNKFVGAKQLTASWAGTTDVVTASVDKIGGTYDTVKAYMWKSVTDPAQYYDAAVYQVNNQ